MYTCTEHMEVEHIPQSYKSKPKGVRSRKPSQETQNYTQCSKTPPCADEVFVGRKLNKEMSKGNTQVLKEVMAHTLYRGECPPLSKILEEYPLLKKATSVRSMLFSVKLELKICL